MGMEEEFEAIFDLLDPTCRGSVDAGQLQEFHKAVFFTSINSDQIDAALSQVCNGGDRCPKFCFLDVLLELERRRTVEERAWWDFQALDSRGNCRITPREALILMKATHQERFTMLTWQTFLESRGVPRNEDVSFNQIRMWLCNPPLEGGEEYGMRDIITSGEKLDRERRKADYQDHKEFLALQEDELSQTLEAQDRHQYQDKFRSKARRKLNRWVNLGVEALIFDDGQDYEVDYKMRNRVTVQDLLEALEQKYDILREKLLWEAVKKHVGDPIWSSMSEGEQQEQVLRVQMKEHRLRRSNDLDQISKLVISYQHYDSRLEAMMGGLRSEFERRNMDHENKVAVLQNEGKTDDQIYEIFATEYAQRVQGATTCGQLLVDLHKRHVKEREFLLSVLKMGNRRALTSAEMITEYSSLAAQQLIASYEGESFEYSSMATGLAERPQQFSSGFDSDRDLGELLALERLHQRKGKRPPKVTDDDGHLIGKNRGIVAWQVEVVRQLLKKHSHEREVMVYLLQGKESSTWLSVARQKSQEQRENRLKELRQQRFNWRQGPSEHLTSKRTIHLKILLEGTGLYHENRRSEIRGGHNFTDNQVSACMLADLQQRQAREVDRVLVEMQIMTAEVLKELWRREHRSRIEEWLDNVSAVILSTFELSEEDKELIQALEDKYDVLRDKILTEQLMMEFGEAEWLMMTEQERQRLLMKRKMEEKRLRREGKMDELSRLISGADKDSKRLQKLMGKNREEYEKQLAARLARRERRRAMGLDSDESDESDSEEPGGAGGQNVLQDLQYRYNEDMDALMALLRKQQDSEMSGRERQALLLRLRREKRRAAMEDNFDEAALLLGLAERNRLNMEERMKADRERQLLLARERLANRRRRKADGKGEIEDHEELPVPNEGDIEGWRETVLKEMDRKHVRERELLLTILIDEGSEELRDAASQMVQKTRQERLQELREEAEQLNPDKKEEREGRRDILEEAGAIKSILRRMSLKTKRHGEEVEMDEVNASLLADLQEEQERESEVVLAGLVSLSEEELSKMRMRQVWEAKMNIGQNLLTVFTQYEGAAEDDDILKALDKKYDALKDKLLIDILRSQLGEKEWARMKEQDRQRKLLELKQEERRLRKEGKMDALAALLGDHAKTEADLKKLMGDSRVDYQEKLKRRIEKRKKRIAEGGNLDDIEEEGLSEDEDDSKDPSSNPLNDLQRRYDSEREAILMRLNSSEAEFMSEKERQTELVRLRLELRKARGEDNFVAAALVIGLTERNQALASERLRNDRQRQESLAKQRIEAMRRKRALGTIQEETEETVTDNDDRNSMQDAVIRTLEKKHRLEREALYDLLQAKYGEDDILIAQHMTQEQRQEVLQELMEQRRATDIGQTQEHRVILGEASIVKMAGRKQRLEKETAGAFINKDDVIVTIMADLQQQQARESETVLSQLPDKDLKSLVHVQQQNIEDQKTERNENVATVLMTADLSKLAGEEELVDALQGKFDALRDKILAEALMKQIGEAEWARLSEKERQVRLIKLRLEERRLRQAGKYNEAAALLGDAIASQTALELLLGDTKKQQEEKMKERLEKRRQRMAQGMTEEEISRLEQEEIEQEEEELRRKKPRNILDDLDNRLDAERDALLAGMRDANDRLLSERERQRELARLRREQRKARKEQKFDAAALAIGLAKQAEDAEELREKERRRQLQLAKERLAQRRKTKEERRQARDAMGPVPMPEDEQSEVMMQEAVIQEMEVKHEAERDLLIELMQDQEDSGLRTNAKQMIEDNRQKKLQELKGARQEWRDSRPSKENQEEQMDLFNKATALTLESRLDEAKQTQGENVADSEIQIALLADLQQQQEQEASHLMDDLGTKTITTLKQLKQVQYIARANGWNDNVAGTVLVTKLDSSEVTEEQLIKALEIKYDTLRDKLLSEALMKQMGEGEWARLSERERQGKLMKLKLQERKLRQEGKYDEAAALLGQGIKNQQELAKLLGNTKTEQEERLKQRLERRRQLLEERTKEGLAVDEETLDKIIDKEEKRRDFIEERKKRRNILEDLNSHFEDEKDQLLAALRGQTTSFNSERDRQLALAKLRRDQRKLQMEDKFDTAALIFSMAQQQEKDRESNWKKDKEQQKQLAQERIANLRKKKASSQSTRDTATTEEWSQEDLVMRLREEEEENAKVDAVVFTQKDVGVALHTTILDEMEKKHGMERDVLLELVEAARSNRQEVTRVEQLTDEELIYELRISIQSWEEREQQLAGGSGGGGSSNLDAIAELQHQKRQALKLALLLRIEDYRRTLKITTKMTTEQIQEEVLVSFLAELQQKQSAESKALNKILSSEEDPEMPKADDALLKQLITSQRTARRELQLKNLEAVVFSGLTAINEEDEVKMEEESRQEEEKMMQELEQEMEKDKQELQEKGPVNAMKAAGENVDTEAMLAELEAQHAAKRKAIQDQLQRQRRLMRNKLAERRQRQEDKEYEEDAAMALIQNAEEMLTKRDKNAQMMKEKQTSLMKDRLAQRREKRHQAELAKEEEERQKREVEEKAKKSQAAAAKERLPPGFGMQREKTVIDVSVSEEKKQALFNSLVREHTKAQIKIEMEQEKQTQLLKERLQQRKNRYQDAATMLLGLGERQKTMVAKSQKEERDRQLTMVKERIEKVRYERTQTMMAQKDKNTKTFKDMMGTDKDDDDEKMAQLAASMQQKFMHDEQEIRKGNKRLVRYSQVEATAPPPAFRQQIPTILTVAPDDDATNGAPGASASLLPSAEGQPSPTSKKLGDRERTMMMKEKLAKKRKNRRASLVAAPDMDSLSQMIKEQKEEGPGTLAEELTLS